MGTAEGQLLSAVDAELYYVSPMNPFYGSETLGFHLSRGC